MKKRLWLGVRVKTGRGFEEKAEEVKGIRAWRKATRARMIVKQAWRG